MTRDEKIAALQEAITNSIARRRCFAPRMDGSHLPTEGEKVLGWGLAREVIFVVESWEPDE